MSVIDEVRQEREDLARVLKKHSGIRKIVEELYPDSAHVIYELLQNAEDTGATTVGFVLTDTGLQFKHDGRPFNERNVYAITDIGEGTKAEDNESIGRFGVGFKAVFAYTETPRIWSPTYSFEISELVLPSELPSRPELGQLTLFEFPFNNRKKPEQTAFEEVLAGLEGLSETTLLFLSHIRSIHWRAQGRPDCRIQRVLHSDNHIETLKQSGGTTMRSSHFLRFTQPVEGLVQRHTSVAFALDPLPAVSEFDPNEPLAKQFRIVPALPGRVAVFFTAEKETSGLRFHVHAPFVPELSRASVKDTPANEPLFSQLASLTAQSLFAMRDLGLLTADALAVLPNPNDTIGRRFDCIRRSVIAAMNQHPLTPTVSKGHEPAKHLLQARAALKALLTEEDLEFLVDHEDAAPQWAISAPQRNSDADRFLSGLAIVNWDIEQFVALLVDRLNTEDRFDRALGMLTDEPDPGVLAWVSAKTDEWHQRLYALLYRELEPNGRLGRLKHVAIVRLQGGLYKVGSQCFFPTSEVEVDPVLPRVRAGTYSSGRAAAEQESARKFLEGIGVREVGEVEQVEALLNLRYSREAAIPDAKTYRNDLRKFVELVEKDTSTAKLFREYWIFERSDEDWGRPGDVYLDAPYIETDLSSFFAPLQRRVDCAPLSDGYLKSGISVKRIAQFAQLVGAKTRLEISVASCSENPDWFHLIQAPGSNWTSSGMNVDYTVKFLGELLAAPSLQLARLIWRTFCRADADTRQLRACYRRNGSHSAHYAHSQVVHMLRKAAWVPQGGDTFSTPAEATHEHLPDGFPFDRSWPWIKAFDFGSASAKRLEEGQRRRELAKDLGFDDEDALSDGAWFAKLSKEERRRLKSSYGSDPEIDLPESIPRDAETRAARVGERAKDAPERTSEPRMRSVSVGREEVKNETTSYLRDQYTNGDGVMICQVCRGPLPFKLSDGTFYFEKVEFLKGLKRRHYQNYLALCPNHAAMYMYANGARELEKDLLLDVSGNLMETVLAGDNATLYFTSTHLLDLRAVVSADSDSSEDEGAADDPA